MILQPEDETIDEICDKWDNLVAITYIDKHYRLWLTIRYRTLSYARYKYKIFIHSNGQLNQYIVNKPILVEISVRTGDDELNRKITA